MKNPIDDTLNRYREKREEHLREMKEEKGLLFIKWNLISRIFRELNEKLKIENGGATLTSSDDDLRKGTILIDNHIIPCYFQHFEKSKSIECNNGISKRVVALDDVTEEMVWEFIDETLRKYLNIT